MLHDSAARRAVAAFSCVDWPHRWRDVAAAYTEPPPDVTAVTGLASFLTKLYGGTEDELRAVLECLDNVLL